MVLNGLQRGVLWGLWVVATLLLMGLVITGFLMRILYHNVSFPVAPTWGNCWSYAIPRWLIDPRMTYIVIRVSKANAWPHVFFARSINTVPVKEFVPLQRRKGWRSLLHAFWFHGRIRQGVGEESAKRV